MRKFFITLSIIGLATACSPEITLSSSDLQQISDAAADAAANAAANAASSAASTAATNAVNAAFNAQDAANDAANQPPATLEHEGLITGNETWAAATTHFLNDKVVVADGAVLTIEPGTVIKGRASTTPEDAAALVIARGGKIYANGTADNPIIFTSEQDNLNGNLTSEDKGLWGGVIMLGKAKISVEGDGDDLQIEGIPAEDTFGLYGGNDDTDNSGVLKYISIRHGGANIGEGNEINGFTCGGCGSGTSISNIEVYANKDDGIEMFGGTANITNAIVWHVGDDSVDTDQAYSGTIDNVVIIKNDDPNGAFNGDHGLELDGAEGAYQASNPTFHTIKNITYKGGSGEIADLRDGVRVKIQNLYAFGMGSSEDIEIDEAVGKANYDAGTIIFDDLELNDTRAANAIVVDKSSGSTVGISEDDIVTVTSQSSGQGATTSVFSWTQASTSGVLDF